MRRLIFLLAAIGMMGTSPPPPPWQPQPWVPVERPSEFPVAPPSPNYRPPVPTYSPQHFPAMNQQPVTIRPEFNLWMQNEMNGMKNKGGVFQPYQNPEQADRDKDDR